jgi:hypothetical protein
MGVVATFDYGSWSAQYPDLVPTVSSAQAQAYWNIAVLYHRNDGGGPISDVTMQQTLLNMVTAHIAMLRSSDSQGNPPPTLVGRIASASEGSVSASTDYPVSPSGAWFNQTQPGAMYWELTSSFRSFRYVRAWSRF